MARLNFHNTANTQHAVEAKQIAEMIELREIAHLVHFTHVSNLPNIMKHGLLGRTDLEKRGIEHSVTDHERFDGNRNAISLSVSFPNWQMFFKKRQDYLRQGVPEHEWVVLLLDPELLTELPALFSPTNAASNSTNKAHTLRKGITAFESMFADDELRNTLRLSDDYTTDPQAEVQVMAPIHPKWIQEICIKPGTNRRALQHAAGLVPVYEEPAVFERRFDWQHWRRH